MIHETRCWSPAARRRHALVAMRRSRVPQTNEVGRSALLLIGLVDLTAEVGPLAQLDVGAIAGLNLMLDRFAYDCRDRHLGSSAIALRCDVRGPAPPDRLPTAVVMIASRLGLDASPIDVGDPDQVRWLEACVWPHQADRFNRLRAALAEAAQARVPMMVGEAVGDVGAAVAHLGEWHPVVTTSWVRNYLGEQRRRDLLEAVGRIAETSDLSLVSHEAPALTLGLGWRNGACSDGVLDVGHHHGSWFSWRRASAFAPTATQHLADPLGSSDNGRSV